MNKGFVISYSKYNNKNNITYFIKVYWGTGIITGTIIRDNISDSGEFSTLDEMFV